MRGDTHGRAMLPEHRAEIAYLSQLASRHVGRHLDRLARLHDEQCASRRYSAWSGQGPPDEPLHDGSSVHICFRIDPDPCAACAVIRWFYNERPR